MALSLPKKPKQSLFDRVRDVHCVGAATVLVNLDLKPGYKIAATVEAYTTS